MDESFPYEVDRRFLAVLPLFGFRKSKHRVTVSDAEGLTATFGWFTLKTPLSNIDGAHITRSYRWWTAIGARKSFVDDGLTFGTNHDAGVCIHFKEKVKTPLGPRGHSALTVTIADLEGLVSCLSVPG